MASPSRYAEPPGSADARPSAPPSALRLLVRDALRHLGDAGFLASHPLAARMEAVVRAGRDTGEALSTRLRAAIDRLAPASPGAAGGLAAARRHRLMHLRYVEGETVMVVRARLSISETEYYRTHARALELVVSAVAADLEPSPPVAVDPDRSPFVGRDHELALLLDCFLDAVGGRTQIVALDGPAGIGKTRLVAELGPRVEAFGGRLLRGRYQRGVGATYAPWVEALRPALRGMDAPALARAAGRYAEDLAQLFPELGAGARAAGGSPAGALSLADRRQRLHDGLARLLTAIAADRPIVLLIDDCHRAPRLLELAQVARRLADARVLLVLASRDAELSMRGELLQDVNDLCRDGVVTALELRPLDEAATAALVCERVGDATAQRIAPAIHRATGGNPFFVEAMLASLHDRGLMAPGAVDAAAVEVTMRLPRAAQRLIRERAALLGAEGADVLARASVLGSEFRHADLLALSERDDDTVSTALGRALAMRLLVDASDGATERYRFADERVKDALYDTTPAPQRRRWHRRAGEVLAARVGAGDDAHVEELARQFARGGDAERGAAYSARAGQRAAEACAWPQAIRHYRRALALWEGAGGHPEERADVAFRLGETIHRSAIDASQGIEYLHQSLALAEQLADRHRQGVLHLAIGREYANGANAAIRDEERAVAHLQDARTILESMPESPELCDVYWSLATSHAFRTEGSRLIEWAGRAVEVAERLGDPARIVRTEGTLGAAYAAVGRIGAGLQRLEHAHELAVTHRLGWAADLALTFRCFAERSVHPERVLEIVRAARTRDTKPALLDLPGHVLVACARTGDLAHGREVLTALHARLGERGQPAYAAMPAEVGLFLAHCASLDDAESLLDRALAWARESHDRATEGLVLASLAEVAFLRDDYATAEQRFAEVCGAYARRLSAPRLIDSLALFAESAVAVGRPAQARATLQELRDRLRRPDTWGRLSAAVDLAEGVVTAAERDVRAADAYFARALAYHERHDLRWEQARTHRAWGRALAASTSRAVDARAHLALAGALWRDMGAPALAESCVAP